VTVPDHDEAADRRLVERIGRADEEAFRELFERHGGAATALARRVVRQPHLAEEIVQEAFLNLWRDPDGFRADRGSVRAWLFGMVHHRAVDLIRREEAQRRRADEMVAGLRDELADPADDVVDEVARPQERRMVRAALSELPGEQREVLELMYFEGLTQTQVAERTRQPLGTVKSRALLGMRRLRVALEDLER
jgi:RNA polymerase sigma-70 factor (ECF subfamily)